MRIRQDVPVEETWNLQDLYSEPTLYDKDLGKLQLLTEELVAHKGYLTYSADGLYQMLQVQERLGKALERVAAYARLTFDSDMGNPQSKRLYEGLDNLLTSIGEKLSFIEPELLQMEPATFEAYLAEKPELKHFQWMMTKLFRQKAHILSTEEEEIMTRMGSLAGSFDKIFDDLTVNDIQYPTIEDDKGQPLVANEANYRKTLESQDRSLRQRYYDALLGTYSQYINTITSTLIGNTKYHVMAAKTRGYGSSLEKALSPGNIPTSVYDNLIATVGKSLQPLQDYLAFRQEVLGYETLHFYDLFVPLLEDHKASYTFEQAQAIVLEAVAPLGEDYQKTLKRAFDERWIDIYPNKGKATGAYAMGVYGVHPFSLLNFNGTLDDIFTLAHEMGHAMHSYYSDTHQPYVDASYSIFTAEVASTVNEYLLFHHLLSQAETPQEKVPLLSNHLDGIRSTLYRQTFFADFERTMHQMVEKDEPMVADRLCELYKGLYERYYGPLFTIDDSLTYEWARIPHFYRPFYVYQYATGISAAIALAKGVLENGEPAIIAYLDFLKSGGSKDPIDLLRHAGVDMSRPEPIKAAIADFQETLNQLRQAMVEMGKTK